MEFDEWEKMKEYNEGRGAYQSLYDAVKKTVDKSFEGVSDDNYIREKMEAERRAREERERRSWQEMEALENLIRTADQGDTHARCHLGYMYLNGKEGVATDKAKAAQWFGKAAEQGNPYAQYELGSLYLIGVGVPKDLDKAIELSEKAVQGGEQKAVEFLAKAKAEKEKEERARKEKEALEKLIKAAEQGDANAQYELGNLCLVGGDFVSKDVKKASEWFGKAAEQGNPDAQYELGSLYKQGTGISQDDAKANKWFKKAAKQGNKRAKNFLAEARLEKIGLVLLLIITVAYFCILWGTTIVEDLWVKGGFPRLLPLAAFSVVVGIISLVFRRVPSAEILILLIVIIAQAITAAEWMGDLGDMLLIFIFPGRVLLNIISCIPGLIMTGIAINNNG